MSFLFGQSKTPKEQVREFKRMLDRSVRELDRERNGLAAQEKKTMAEMKKLAKSNQGDALKIMAKDVIRTRQYISKFYNMRCEMQALSLRLQTMSSTTTMTQAMKGAAKAMKSMNASMKLPGIRKVLQEFEKQGAFMDEKEEMIADSIDDAMETDETAEDDMVANIIAEATADAKSQFKGARSDVAMADEEQVSALSKQYQDLKDTK